MRKTEFLQELREALDGEVSASVIQSNISYYDQYISQEAAKGRREEEVIEEIGSPRLIAKTIIVIVSVVVIAILFVLFALVGGIFTILIHLAGPILLIWLIYTFIKNIWK